VSDAPTIVFDASTLVGALIRPDSVPRRAFLLAQASFRLCLSADSIAELQEVLTRPKFERYVPLVHRQNFLNAIVEIGHLWEVDDQSLAIATGSCRDPHDDMIIALAHACGAEVIVSSDSDPLSLNPWNGIEILAPGDFLAKVGAEPASLVDREGFEPSTR
jgi:uncharacterized protein